jgi:tRNA pseudouridine55 synthase
MTRNTDDLNSVDFLEGCSLLINKPKEWTSFDVVNKIRFKLKYHLGVKKIKVGHAGTLDPLATGLLIICTGKFTKKLADFQGLDKTYTGKMILGASTPTYDAESEPDAIFETSHLNMELLQKERLAFIGWLDQIPPIYSAIKINGQKAYDLARRGKDVEMKSRRVNITEFEIGSLDSNELDFKVQCSKGTYIRSLAHDFGKALDCGAYLSELRRTKIGEYKIEDAFELEEFANRVDNLKA